MGDGDLSTELFPLHHQHPVFCPGQIKSSSQSRGATTHHNHIVQLVRVDIFEDGHHSCPTRSKLGFRVSSPGFQLAGQT